MKLQLNDWLPEAIAAGHLSDEQPLACFIDSAGVTDAVRTLQATFPKDFRHAFAAKANAMRPALELVRTQGMGCEVASHGELEQALKAGFTPANIVHDDPAKTRTLLKRLLDLGVSINLDNFQELDRVAALLERQVSDSAIGLRINPQVGAGTISAMSTATSESKFGIALRSPDNREKLIAAFEEYPWLTGLHCHVGSQGCDLELIGAGIHAIVDLAETINARQGAGRVSDIDIGGGLPVNFDGDEVTPTYGDFATTLKREVPALFSGAYRVTTEFGRSLFAKHGYIVSRVEYTKQSGDRHIAITHAGGQVATRTVFMPAQWPLRIKIFDAEGRAKTGDLVEQDIAGPLCFSGDLVARARRLPKTEPGDLVVLPDTGAYYFSMPFFYNALPAPAVYSVERDSENDIKFDCWRPQQSVDDLLQVIG